MFVGRVVPKYQRGEGPATAGFRSSTHTDNLGGESNAKALEKERA